MVEQLRIPKRKHGNLSLLAVKVTTHHVQVRAIRICLWPSSVDAVGSSDMSICALGIDVLIPGGQETIDQLGTSAAPPNKHKTFRSLSARFFPPLTRTVSPEQGDLGPSRHHGILRNEIQHNASTRAR